jgi:hypothetical protein
MPRDDPQAAVLDDEGRARRHSILEDALPGRNEYPLRSPGERLERGLGEVVEELVGRQDLSELPGVDGSLHGFAVHARSPRLVFGHRDSLP